MHSILTAIPARTMKNIKIPKIVVICGPTGIGKTAVGIRLAKRFYGEILSADSMLIYRYMDIGTAKPSIEERTQIPHHLIDIVDPDESFNAAAYSRISREIVFQLQDKGIPPFVVGGTGLYIKAMIHGLFRSTPPDPEIRLSLKKEVESSGLHTLYERLKVLDPESAGRIHPHDAFRIIRALETFMLTGKTISSHHQRHRFSEDFFKVLKIGLIRPRDLLYHHINVRVDRMMEMGFLKEVEGLLKKGFSPDLKSMQSIGYRHLVEFIGGNGSMEEATEKLKRDTRRFAKRQLTWFRADPEVIWKSPENMDEIEKMIESFFNL
ncbi:MAG: tRNA (adenosine(37)-N6)-dimethylallyltransferase MiaA [Thermodesulfobacteriota bacterium]